MCVCVFINMDIITLATKIGNSNLVIFRRNDIDFGISEKLILLIFAFRPFVVVLGYKLFLLIFKLHVHLFILLIFFI